MIGRDEFAQYIDAHHGALYRHALWMTGDAELAADVVQEAYYEAWRGLGSLRDPTRVFPWLLTILRRRVFQEYGRARREREWTAQFATALPAASVDSQHEALLDLARALQALSTSQRDIMLLYGLHGMSYESIAEYLQVPIGTVMSRLARARESLRAQTGTAATDNVVPLNRKRSPHDG